MRPSKDAKNAIDDALTENRKLLTKLDKKKDSVRNIYNMEKRILPEKDINFALNCIALEFDAFNESIEKIISKFDEYFKEEDA